MAYGPRPDNVYLELNEVGKQVSGSSAPHTAAHQPLAPDLRLQSYPVLLHVSIISYDIHMFTIIVILINTVI